MKANLFYRLIGAGVTPSTLQSLVENSATNNDDPYDKAAEHAQAVSESISPHPGESVYQSTARMMSDLQKLNDKRVS